MKKGIIGIIILVIVLGGGFYLYYNSKQAKKTMEKEITTAANDYFENNISTNTGVNGYKITLKTLKTNKNYKLDSLKGCNEKETYAYVVINMTDGTVKRTDVKLNCKGIIS